VTVTVEPTIVIRCACQLQKSNLARAGSGSQQFCSLENEIDIVRRAFAEAVAAGYNADVQSLSQKITQATAERK
jgi:hypothetical protein